MPAFLIYILKLSVSLAVVFLFYRLFLHRLTFYNWNRWYLLGYTMLAFFIPFLDISTVLEKQNLVDNTIVQWVPLVSDATQAQLVTVPSASFFTTWNIISLLMLTGMTVMLIRLLVQLISFRRMLKKAAFIPGTGMKIFHVDEQIIPFSFGDSIFINRNLHSEVELQEIIRHEFVHVKQVHSIDIIWGEFLCLLNWYNPFAWMLKKSIRQNLEFIADHKVLENGIAKKEYQYLLLKVMGNNQYSIANQFNFSSLKKRIAMMNKLKSAKVHLVKFLFILPVLAIILLSFRNRITGNDTLINSIADALQDTVPAKNKLPDNVKGVRVKEKKITVTLKDGTREVYDLANDAEQEAFEKKYGDIIPPPPPPPPAPPTPPTAPPPPPPPTIVTPPALPDNVKRISVDNDDATVWLKDGTTEKYNLSDATEKKVFEKKYGVLPPPIPPIQSITPIAPMPAIAPIAPMPAVAPIKSEAVGYNSILNDVAKEFEITDTKAVITLKNGRVERYDLTDKTSKKQFEKKYGKLYPASAPSRGATPVAYMSGSGTTVIAPMAPMPGERPMIVDDYGYSITGKEDVLITITKNTTRSQLDNFIKQMKAKDIELHFENINYNDGVLTEISGYMKSRDGRSNFVANDFYKLVLATIKKGERTYFKVSIKDDQISI